LSQDAADQHHQRYRAENTLAQSHCLAASTSADVLGGTVQRRCASGDGAG
jgi:hypothetical protein